MKAIAYLVLALATGLPQTNVQVDIVRPADSRITIERTTAPYAIALTNNTTHAITGLVVEWAAGGPPQVLLLGHYGFKEAVVPAKGMIVFRPPDDITVIPLSMDRGRRIVGPAAPPAVSRVVIAVATVIFDDGKMIGPDRYNLVATITARTELPAALAAAEARWAMKKPGVYEFTYKRICFCPPVPPGKPGSEPIVFRVINDVGYLQGAWSDRPEAQQGLDPYRTVEKLFTYIRAELAKHPFRAEIDYDPDDGHPTRVYIDPLQNTFDEEYGFTIKDFRRLR